MNQPNDAVIFSEEIFKGVHRITLNQRVYSYLLTGSEKTLLIDTGWGTSDLKKQVESISTLPLTVVNSHGHLDHIYGNYQFDEIYIMDEDLPLVKYDYSAERRLALLNRYGSENLPEGMSSEEWCNAKSGSLLSLNGVSSFDLGDRVIELIPTPGHTAGSVCFLDRSLRILFTGDSVYEGPIMLHFNLSSKLPVYLDSVRKLIAESSAFDHLLPSHRRSPVEVGMLTKVESAVTKIISGEIVGTWREIFGRRALGCDFDGFSILYREDSIG